MLVSVIYSIALVASLIWFLAAFRLFSFRPTAAARLLVPSSARTSPLFPTIAAAARFLGGMNGAFALLAALLVALQLTGSDLFREPRERGILLLVFAAAHFSQFVFNLPIMRQRQGERLWPVLSGKMFFIFVVDAIQTVVNLVAALVQFGSR